LTPKSGKSGTKMDIGSEAHDAPVILPANSTLAT
jgi:hypothetical protein